MLLCCAFTVVSAVYQRVFSWGLNRYGSSGFGFLSSADPLSHCAPELVSEIGWPVLSSAGLVLDHVSAGYDATLAFTTDGSVFAWGRNDRGQLGLGANVTRQAARPERIAIVPDGGARDGCCGQYHCLLLTVAGRLYSAGDGASGALGLGSGTRASSGVWAPVAGALAGRNVTRVVCGAAHALALTDDGSLFGWGGNEEGQLGQCQEVTPPGGASDPCLSPLFAPALVPGLPPLSLVATGGGFNGGAEPAIRFLHVGRGQGAQRPDQPHAE
jgi:alpha-tubulin suppressor-like RCC1 family protein